MVKMRMTQEKFRSRQFFKGKTTPLVLHHIQISQQSVGTGIGSDILRVTRNLFSQAEKKISLGRPLSSFKGLPMVRGQLVIKNLPLNGPSFSGQNQNPKVLFELNVGQGKFGIKNPLKIVVVDGAKVHAQIYCINAVTPGDWSKPKSEKKVFSLIALCTFKKFPKIKSKK